MTTTQETFFDQFCPAPPEMALAVCVNTAVGSNQAPMLWQKTLHSMTTSQLRDFLLRTLSKSKELQEQLILEYQQDAGSQVFLDFWKEQIRQIVRAFRPGNRAITDKEADRFYLTLNGFLTQRLSALLSSGKMLSAFSLVCTIFDTAITEAEGDSAGGMGILFMTCTDAWRKILSAASETQRSEAYSWFASKAARSGSSCWTESIVSFLFTYPWKEPYLRKNLVLLDLLLEKQENCGYLTKMLLDWRESTMYALGASGEQINDFWRKYWCYDFVRDREIHRFLEMGEYDLAITLLRREKQFSVNNPARLKSASRQLIQLYEQIGQKDAYQEELISQIQTFPQSDLNYIRKLREILPPQSWEYWKKQLFDIPTTKAVYLDLLAYCGQFPRLLAEIEYKKEFSLLERFLEPLMVWNAEETKILFCNFLNAAMVCAGDRNTYRLLFSRLALLKPYPGGSDAIHSLTSIWEDHYHRRTAMLDELHSARQQGLL